MQNAEPNENPFAHAGIQLMLFVTMVLKGRTTAAAVDELVAGNSPREKMRLFNRCLETDPHFEAEWLRVLNSIRGVGWSEEEHAQHRAYMAIAEPAFRKYRKALRGGVQDSVLRRLTGQAAGGKSHRMMDCDVTRPSKSVTSLEMRARGGRNSIDGFTKASEAGRVTDADGSRDADARTRALHFSGQGVHPIEPEWLTVEQMRVIAGIKARNSRYW